MNPFEVLPDDVKVMDPSASDATRTFISEALNVPPLSVPGAHVEVNQLDSGMFVIFVTGRITENPRLS